MLIAKLYWFEFCVKLNELSITICICMMKAMFLF